MFSRWWLPSEQLGVSDGEENATLTQFNDSGNKFWTGWTARKSKRHFHRFGSDLNGKTLLPSMSTGSVVSPEV